MMNKLLIFLLFLLPLLSAAQADPVNYARPANRIWLDSEDVHRGAYTWKMKKDGDVKASPE